MKDLSYFMRDQKEEIVTAPAPRGLVDDDGKPLELEIRVLSADKVQDIFAKYRRRSIATNGKGVPYISANNEAVYSVERDNPRAIRHIIAEALAYPNLKDPGLMEFHNCRDISEMAHKVFWRPGEYGYVSKMVMDALGLGDSLPSNDELLEDAKN